MTINYLVCGDYLLTMNDQLDLIKNGAVAVRDNKIVEVGEQTELLKKYPEAKVVGGKHHVVMPGLINTHSHAAMVYLRGVANDLLLKDWLEKYIWPLEKQWVKPEYVFDATELACLEMIKGGTTTFVDMYFYSDSVARAAKKIGMRGIIAECVFDFPTNLGNNASDYLNNSENFIKNWLYDDLITPSVCAHAAYTCSPATLVRARALANKYQLLLQIHLAETEWEFNEISKQHGKTPTAHLNAVGLFDGTVIAAHSVFLTDADIEILARKNIGVAHCMQSNLKLASGFAPIEKMLKAGVNVSLATDGAASNDDLSLFGEMNSVALAHKAITKDPTALAAKTVVAMATRGGAKVIGRADDLGSLVPGYIADIITLDIHKPHLVPMYDLYSHLVYAAHAGDVNNVMINGRPIMQNRELMTCDENGIIDRAIDWQQKIIAAR